MERPRLFEYPIYAVIVGATAAWVFALPPFTFDPSQRSTAETQPVADTTAREQQRAAMGETETAAAQSTDLAGPGARTEPRSLARDDDGESNSERTALSQADADEQPQLDPQPNLLRVTANSLNMRAEPNARSPRVASYPRGAVVEPVTKQGNWVLVRTVDDAVTGWMYAEYLDQVAEN